MSEFNLKKGDILLTRNETFLSKAIRIFQQDPNESRSVVSHVGIVVEDGTESSAVIIEALTKVRRHTIEKAYGKSKEKLFIARPCSLSEDNILKVVAKAEQYNGKTYGYLKVAAHALDRLFRGQYVFRRLCFMDDYPICSWIVAYSYDEINYRFGVLPTLCQPDDIWDNVKFGMIRNKWDLFRIK